MSLRIARTIFSYARRCKAKIYPPFHCTDPDATSTLRDLFIPKASRTRLKGDYPPVFQLPPSRDALSHRTISDCECSQLQYLESFPVFCLTFLSEDSNERIRPVIFRYDIEGVLQNDRNGTHVLASTVLTTLDSILWIESYRAMALGLG